MGTSGRSSLAGVVLAALVPCAAGAQTMARSFGELAALLPPSSIVIVVDGTGQETWGRIVEVTPTALSVAIIEKSADGLRTTTTSDRRTFTEDRVATIVLSDVSGRKGTTIYPASWHELDRLAPGAPLRVVLDTGERRDYRFEAAGPGTLVLATPSGQPDTIEKARIRRVLLRDVDDPTANGILAGALAGAGVGLATVAVARAQCGPGCNDPSNPTALAFSFTAFSAAVGTLVGWVADKLHKGTDVIFPVPPAPGASVTLSPVVAVGRKGLSVSVSF